MNNFDYLLQLPGEEREREWIRTRLEMLSAQENILLTAAVLKEPPQNTVDAVNQLNSLFLYWACENAGSYEQLGEFYLKQCCKIPETTLPYVDLTKAGMYFAGQNPGRFVENFYVAYPEFDPKPFYQGQGAPLPSDDWGIKLKLASPAVPEGVWMGVPGRDSMGNVAFVEEDVTKAVLHVRDWDECTLLDARCILPGISGQDLMEQYSDVADLVKDGVNLGNTMFWDWATPPEQYTAALELEGCHNLKLALDIYQNLSCYDWVPLAEQKTAAQKALTDARVPEKLIESGAIDLDRYGAQMMEDQGYTLTADGAGYIRRNANEFSYQFSSPPGPDTVLSQKPDGPTLDADSLAKLPGTEQEQAWVQERLDTLSVREGIILNAAMQHSPPKTAVDAINCLQTLDYYVVHPNLGSDKALGKAYLQNGTTMPDNTLPFVNLEQMGQQYREKHPGQFLGNCYVEYPSHDVQLVYSGQGTLPEDKDWSVKLKAASSAVPEGVWLRMPGSFQDGLNDTVDEALALQVLQIQRWDECTLLDAQCILPGAGDLLTQYDDVGDLIYDGIELGYALDHQGQGAPHFMERYTAAMELEGCQNLKLALDISQNLKCYDWVPCTDLETSAVGLLLDAGLSEELIHSGCIDLPAYKAHQLEEQGYILTADKSGYIARNSQEFYYTFSTPTPEQSGMTMQ